MFDGLAGWVESVIESMSYVGVAILVALESVFPPIPSEIVLPFAGFVAGRGDASVIGMIGAATVGSVVGAWVLYAVAAWIGHDRLHRFVGKHGKWFGVSTDEVARAEAWFDRRSTMAVMGGRCVPLIRSLVSIPAGFRKMEPVRFTVLTAIGSLVWNTALIGAGAALGKSWEDVGSYVSVLQYFVIAGILIGIVYFVVTRLRARRSV